MRKKCGRALRIQPFLVARVYRNALDAIPNIISFWDFNYSIVIKVTILEVG